MSRQDPAAAGGVVPRAPGRCGCGHLEPLHVIKPAGGRGGCSGSCTCRQYEQEQQPMAQLIRFPGAGVPAPGGTPPVLAVDLDGVADRYTAYCEAVAAGDGYAVRLLGAACADDIPGMQAEITRLTVELEQLRAGGVR